MLLFDAGNAIVVVGAFHGARDRSSE